MGLGNPSRGRHAGRRTMRQRAVAALLGAAAFAPLPAAGQATDTTQAQVGVLDPVTIGPGADMDFGQITTSGNPGTVVMAPVAAPTCPTTGGLVRTGTCRSAMFEGDAYFLADLRVQRPTPDWINLVGPGGATMRLETFTFGSSFPTVYNGATGVNHRFRVWSLFGDYRFYVGGTLRVAGNQMPGVYNGTFAIQVNYN